MKILEKLATWILYLSSLLNLIAVIKKYNDLVFICAVIIPIATCLLVIINAVKENKKRNGQKCGVCGTISNSLFCPECGNRLVSRIYDEVDVESYKQERENRPEEEYDDYREEYADTDEDIAKIQRAILIKNREQEDYD